MHERELIGAKVVSKAFGQGTVLDAKDGKVTIGFPKGTKTLSLEIAYRSGSLRFEDETINLALEQNEKAVQQKQEEWDASAKANRKLAEAKIEQFRQQALSLEKENNLRKRLFGSDYVYEEFEEFRKKNHRLIIAYFDYHTAYRILGDIKVFALGVGDGFGLSDHF